MKNRFYLTANLSPLVENDAVKREVAAVIDLPTKDQTQPDLGYFSAILVSTGTNLNGAHFLGSEMVAAADTVVKKAVDVEHVEEDIIGHIYSSAFTDAEGNALDIKELSSKETATLDAEKMHIQIGCVVYKDRFPEIAKEIAAGEWKVSMECYYTSFDLKVGDMVIPKNAAASLGIDINNDANFGVAGKTVKVMQAGKELCEGKLERVLRGICFSGVGIVENPANPESVILETASKKEDIISLELVETASSNNVTSKQLETELNKADIPNDTDMVDDLDDDELPDQKYIASKLRSKASAQVEALFDRKRKFTDTKSKLNRLHDAIDKASKAI